MRGRRRLAVESLEPRQLLDSATAQVLGVTLGSSAWSQTFIDTLQARALGQGGYRVPVGSLQEAPTPWAHVDRIIIDFDVPVTVQADHLRLEGVHSAAPEIIGFELQAGGTRAVWRLAAPLTSDNYQITLSENVRDLAGNRLDGEWADGHSTVSGNGLPGGDFRFGFGVQVGDVNQDYNTTVADRGLAESLLNIGTAAAQYNPLSDINGSGVINAADVDLVAAAFADWQPLGGHRRPSQIRTVGDINGNGAADLAVLLTAGPEASPRLMLVDGDSGQTLGKINLNAGFTFLDLEIIPNAQGPVAQVAVLGVGNDNGGVRVWVWDLASNQPVRSIAYGKSILARDLEVIRPSGGQPLLLGVLGQQQNNHATAVWVRDAQTGAYLGRTHFGLNYSGIEVETIYPTSGAPQLAVLGTVDSTGGTRVKVQNIGGGLLHNIAFGMAVAVDLEIVTSTAGAGPALALLEQTTGGLTRIEIKRIATGQSLSTVDLYSGYTPVALEAMQDSNGARLLVLAEHPAHHHTLVGFVDSASGAHLQTLSLGAGLQSAALATFPLAGGPTGVAVVQLDRANNLAQVKMRADDDTRLRTVPLIDVTTTVPTWYDAHRVQGHTRLWPSSHRADRPDWLNSEQASAAAAAFAELGAGAFTRHVKSGDEDPWWPSELPVDEDNVSILAQARTNRGYELAAGENLIQAYVNEAAAAGLPMLAYFFDTADARLAEAHPEWVVKDALGNPVAHPRGLYMDITGPYGEVVLQRLLELADMGVAGIYLDFRHLPAGGSYGTQLAADFQQEFGVAPPPPSQSDLYHQFLEFQGRRLNETIATWQAVIAEQYPSLQLVVSTTSIPGLTFAEMTTELANIGTPKNEFAMALRPGQNNQVFERHQQLLRPDDDIRMAFGFALLRDAAENGAPHIWSDSMSNGDHVRAFIAAVTTYGGIAALDVNEELLLPGGTVDGIASREELAAGFALGDLVSPHLQGTDAVRWAAVHFSENARDARGRDTLAAWEETIWPALGAFQVVQESGRSVGIVTDWQLARAPQTAMTVTQGAHGSVIINEDGTLRYTPNAGFTGIDSFTYSFNTPGGATDETAVRVLVEASASSASLFSLDTATHGDWKGVYGAQGYKLAQDGTSLPAGAAVSVQGALEVTWAPSTTDTRGLERAGSASHFASGWTNSNQFSIDVNFTDGQPHQVSLYMVDWDNGGRAQEIEVVNVNTGEVIDTKHVSSYSDGRYLTWQVAGQVRFNIRKTSGANAVINGIFIDPGQNSPPTAVADSAATTAGAAVNVAVLANDSDADGDSLSLSQVGQGAGGTVVKNANNTLTYTPGAGFTGEDIFTYTVLDSAGGSTTSYVHVTVSPQGQATATSDDATATRLNQSVIIDVLANDEEVPAIDEYTNDPLAGYKVLFLPNPEELTSAQQRTVDYFVARGGVVINNNPAWAWSTASGNQAAENALAAQLNNIAGTAMVETTGGPEGVHTVAYQSPASEQSPGRIAIAVTNDFTFVQTSADITGAANPAPPPVPAGVQIRLRTHLHPEWANLEANQLYAYDAVSGQKLTLTHTTDGITVSLPSFEHMALVVIEPLVSL